MLTKESIHEKRQRNLLQYLFMTMGSVVFAVGIYFFRIPNNFVVGGASGLSIVFDKIFPVLSVGQFVTIINSVCIVIGWIALGKAFSWKTVYCSLIYSFSIIIFEEAFVIDVPLTNELFLELVFSAILCGIGAGMVIFAGGSTGGIEIFALIIRLKTRFSVGNILMIFNLLVVTFSANLFGVKTFLFSILGVLIHSIIVDKVIQYFNSAKLLLIVTQQEKSVCEYINNTILECATVMDSVGSFENTDNKLVLVVLDRKKAVLLKKMIKKIDETAFVVEMGTFETIGGKVKKIL